MTVGPLGASLCCSVIVSDVATSIIPRSFEATHPQVSVELLYLVIWCIFLLQVS